MRVVSEVAMLIYDKIKPFWMFPMRVGLVRVGSPVFQAWSYLVGIPIWTHLAEEAIHDRCMCCKVEQGDRCGSGCWRIR